VTERDHDALVDDLTRLGRGVTTPPPSEHLATAVLQRVATMPTPAVSAPARWRAALSGLSRWRRRRLVIAALALLVALVATPPVRAAVGDWFGFAGVIVQRGPTSDEPAPPPPDVDDTTTVAGAADLVGFTPWVPEQLGPPDAVDVSADRLTVSMSWDTPEGPVRLDQFDGRLDFRIAKTSPGVQYAAVAGADALWFEEPHEVVLLDVEGNPRTESARLAGHTLIWPVGDITLRLEGDLNLERAVEIGSSAVPYDEQR
jgi:hypothetical protein